MSFSVVCVLLLCVSVWVCPVGSTFVPAKLPPVYQACPPNRYGGSCEHVCRCPYATECDDGVHGNGACICILGMEDTCDATSTTRSYTVNGGVQLNQTQSLHSLVFDNGYITNELRVDPLTLRQARTVRNASISHVLPTRFQEPQMFRVIAIDEHVAVELGMNPSLLDLGTLRLQVLGEVPATKAPSLYWPFAHNYGGYQFGQWAGQLGDGRAVSLGVVRVQRRTMGEETCTVENTPEDWWELSLKGSGRTPYSRSGDGRAVLASLGREYLGAVALNGIGVPAVRALTLVGTTQQNDKDAIWRDEFYNGNVRARAPGVLLRVAPSFLRLGSLQLAAINQGFSGTVQLTRHVLKIIAAVETREVNARRLGAGMNNTIGSMCFFRPLGQPSCAAAHATLSDHAVLECFLQRFAERHAALVAAWNAAGFAHGVQNTDNLSLIGWTIDLNVFGWMNGYDESWTPNHIDTDRRYRFGHQATIAKWNLERVIETLSGSATTSKTARVREGWLKVDTDGQKGRDTFDTVYQACKIAQHSARLGLLRPEKEVVDKWLRWLRRSAADYARASRLLAESCLAHGDERWKHGAKELSLATGAKWAGRYDLVEFFVALNASTSTGGMSPAWRQRVRRATPRYTFRSKAIRKITRVLEEKRGSDSTAFASVAQLLRAPFDDKPWNISAEADRAQGDNAQGRTHGEDTRHLARLLETKESTVTLTSCGGQ